MPKPNAKFDLKKWRLRKIERRKKERETNLVRAKSMHTFRLEKHTTPDSKRVQVGFIGIGEEKFILKKARRINGFNTIEKNFRLLN